MDLDIDRLTLRVSGLSSEADGRRLADLVGHGLASAAVPTGHRDVGSLSVSLPARSGERLESLAQRIVIEILRSLTRSLP